MLSRSSDLCTVCSHGLTLIARSLCLASSGRRDLAGASPEVPENERSSCCPAVLDIDSELDFDTKELFCGLMVAKRSKAVVVNKPFLTSTVILTWIVEEESLDD